MKPSMQTSQQTETQTETRQAIKPQSMPAKRQPTLLCLILAEYDIATGKATNAQILDACLMQATLLPKK